MQRTEGAVTLELPDRDIGESGPGSRAGAFYNPSMALSRDVSVLVHDAISAEVPSLLDGLAGAGARGLRVAAETDVGRVVLNDQDPVAYTHLRDNVARAEVGATTLKAHRSDLRDLLDRVDVAAVDVDPYGTPAPWFVPVSEVLSPGDVLGFSATDTAVLHGRHPDRLNERYGASMVRQDAEKEVGHRVLVGCIARHLADRGLGTRPLLGLEQGHHFRVWVRATPSPRGGIGTARRCTACGHAWLDDADPCRCRSDTGDSGPLWTGPLWDRDLLEALDPGRGTLARPARAAKLVDRLRGEAGRPPLFVDLHRLCKEAGAPAVPSFEDLQADLEERGYTFSRTHYLDTGFRTDAPRRVLGDLVTGR